MSQGSRTALAQPPVEAMLARGLALVAALGGLLFGYDTAVVSSAVGAIEQTFIALPASASSLSGWAISCALLGCAIGAALVGPVSRKIGRGGLLVSAILFVVSSAGAAYPEFGLLMVSGAGPEALTASMLYRIPGGIGIGMASMLAALCIAEIASFAWRGQRIPHQPRELLEGSSKALATAL